MLCMNSALGSSRIQQYINETELNWSEGFVKKGGRGGGGGRVCWELWAFLKCDLTSEAVPGASRDEGIAPVSVEGTGEQ